jgi:hypothetical protein
MYTGAVLFIAAFCAFAAGYLYAGKRASSAEAPHVAEASPAHAKEGGQKLLSLTMTTTGAASKDAPPAASPAAKTIARSTASTSPKNATSEGSSNSSAEAPAMQQYYAPPPPPRRDCERYRSPDNDLGFSACCAHESETRIVCKGQFVNLGNKFGVLNVENSGFAQDNLGNQQPVYRGNINFGNEWEAWLYPPRGSLNPVNFTITIADPSGGNARSILLSIPYEWGNGGFVSGIPGVFIGKFPIN